MKELIAGLRLWQKWVTHVIMTLGPWLYRVIFKVLLKGIMETVVLPVLTVISALYVLGAAMVIYIILMVLFLDIILVLCSWLSGPVDTDRFLVDITKIFVFVVLTSLVNHMESWLQNGFRRRKVQNTTQHTDIK